MKRIRDSKLTRRGLILSGVAAGALAACTGQSKSNAVAQAAASKVDYSGNEWRKVTEAEWRGKLSPEAFKVLRKEGTERAFTSPLNDVKEAGTFHCAGCDLPLFETAKKYDSGTGWPSFYDVLPGAIGTSVDNKLIYSRTEYHCARCLGHQGHVFNDGPAPTGLRYCNNGVALTFKAA